MGAVYEALDRAHDERIALKTLRHTGAHYLYYLKKEFRILQGLHHPNLIRLGELIEERGRWFFTMELIRGADFLAYVRGGPKTNGARGKERAAGVADTAVLDTAVPETSPVTRSAGATPIPDPDDVGRLADALLEMAAPTLSPMAAGTPPPQLANARYDEDRLRAGLRGTVEGIAALHDAGLVHRDIKPSNLMVTEDGRVVVLDFGLVHEQARSKDLQGQPVQLMGTPGYMSPEQYSGDEVTPASDFYSLGVTLYEALTGRIPFRGSPLDILDAVRTRKPHAPSELVVGVPPDLDALCLALLEADPVLRPTRDQIRQALGEAEEPARRSSSFPTRLDTGSSSESFVGRARELAELRQAFAETRSGRPVSIFVEGSSGLGKTALVRHFLEPLEGAGQVVVLTGRCYERESVPYKAFDSLIDDLSWYLKTLPAREVDALMPEHSAGLFRLFPVLDPGGGTIVPRDPANPQDLRSRSFAALKGLLRNIAARNELILSIDDLQWGDADSAALLRELLRPPNAPAMLFVGTYRAENADDPMIADLVADRRRIVLDPLSASESRALIDRIAVEASADLRTLVDEIAREGGGSPFFIGEMVRHLGAQSNVDALPSGQDGQALLRRVIDERVARLPDAAADVLRAAAVIGRPVSKSFIVRVAGLEKPAGRRALEVLDAARMLRTHQKDDVEVYHDQLRASVVAAMAPEAVRDVFNRVAAVLDESNWERSDLLGLDFIASTDPERALRYAIRAAEQAEAAFAFDRAARLYELAIDLAPESERRELRRKYADVLQYGGYAADAARVYLELSEDASGHEERELTRIAADNLLRAGHIVDGLARLEDVAAMLGVRLGGTRTSTLLAIVGGRFRLALRGIGYKPRPASECPPDELARLDSLFAASTTLGLVDYLKGAVMQNEHILGALRLGEEKRACRALAAEVVFLAALGGRHARRAEKLNREVLLHAEELQDPYLLAGANIGAGYIRFGNGQYPLAHESFQAAVRSLDSCPDAWWERNAVRYFDYLVLASMGDFNTLAATLPRHVHEAEERNDRHTRSVLKGHPTVWYMLREDRADEIDAELDSALAEWPADGKYLAHYTAMMGRAMVRLYQGEPRAALQLIDDGKALRKSMLIHRMPFVRSEVDKLRAMAAASLGDWSIAKKSIRSLDKFGVPIARAYSAEFRAPFALRDGDERGARKLLLGAIELFEQAGAGHDAAACRYRAGQLTGGQRGEQLIAQALQWMEGQGVRSPTAMIDYIAPGFPNLA
jgi:serine/threonine protein kinase